MSNLSDLLPAGASAKQITATDSGSGIASKAPVIMNASGTVAAVGIQPESLGSAVVFETGLTTATGSAYDATNKKVVISYRDEGNSNYGTAVVGTVSGTSISFGTPVVFEAASVDHTEATFDSGTGKIVLAYQKVGANGSAIVGTVSGTSISFGTAAQFDSDDSEVYGIAYDSSASKVVISYVDTGNTNRGTAVVGTVSGTSISFGTPVVFDTGNLVDADSGGIVYDITNSKVVLAYRDASNQSHWGAVRVGTVSGTSISFGTKNYFSDYTVYSGDDSIAMTYDSTNSKVIIIGGDGGQSNKGSAHVGTVSGTTISFGTKVAGFTAGAFQQGAATFDSTNGKVLVIYQDNNNSSYGTYYVGTVSGTSISFGSPAVYESATTTNNTAVFDSDQGVSVFGYRDQGNSPGQGTAICQKNTGTNLTAQAFVGVADSAISASAAGSIIVQGGTVSGATASVTVTESLSSPFLYAQDAAADPVGCKASGTGSDNFLIAYEINDGVARGALAQAATVTSGNISYGSSASIGGASTTVYHYSIAYDSTNDKFVVFWQNYSTGYIYGAVVTLTGNSISYGAETAVYSAAGQTGYGAFASTYDPDTDRVILGVCDNGDNYVYSVVIKLGTTTIDTVGTPQKIDSASATVGYAKRLDLCYDTTQDKVIATYVYTGGGGSYYLRVAAGTVAGAVSNSITWGSSSVVYSGDATYPSIAYNATDQRVVVVYKQQADTKGYSSVATVSGTTVTANTPSEFYDKASTGGWDLYFTSLAHDAYVNQMVIYMRASAGDAVYGAIDTGTNSITWSTPPLNVSANAYNPPQVVFNTSTNQTILSGSTTSKATADSFIYTVPGTVTGQPLTTGTKYFVTTTGKFSTTADTPSVNAGLAISTTQLLLNGDS